jgi:ankyrin repeat protein
VIRYKFWIFIFIIFFNQIFAETSSADYLIFSVERGYLNHVKKAINAGANINSRDYFKKTPLIYAAENGHVEILNLLLLHGAAAGIDARDRDGKTALQHAREKSHTKIIQILLEYGAKD